MTPLQTPDEMELAMFERACGTDRHVPEEIRGSYRAGIRDDREAIAQVVQGMIASRDGTWDENTAGRNMALADLLVLLRPGK